MLEGHGDDIYRYDDLVKMNFSSNIYQHADLTALKEFLKEHFDLIANYPEPQPRSLERLIALKEGISPEAVLVTNGATEAIYMIAAHFKNSASVIPQPTFNEYADACRQFNHIISYENNDEMTELPRDRVYWICNPNNPSGMHMHFYWDGQDVVSVWKAGPDHVSWIDTLHGGLQATLLDEICGWVVFYVMQTSGVTAKMEMRYRKAVNTTWPYILLRARLVEHRRNVAIIRGELWSPDGVLCAECTCIYFVYTGEKAREMGYEPATLGTEELTLDEVIAHVAEPHAH